MTATQLAALNRGISEKRGEFARFQCSECGRLCAKAEYEQGEHTTWEGGSWTGLSGRIHKGKIVAYELPWATDPALAMRLLVEIIKRDDVTNVMFDSVGRLHVICIEQPMRSDIVISGETVEELPGMAFVALNGVETQ